MKFACMTLVATLLLAVLSTSGLAAGFGNESFSKTFYFNGPNGLGAKSGLSEGNAKAIADTDLMSIPAGMVIENVYVVIDTAITGSTAIDIGDDDDANGWVPTEALTLGTAGMYGYDAKLGGAYKRIETAGATDAADVYVVPNGKYYGAAGKELKLDNTTTNTAGKFRVVVKGFWL